MRKGYYEAKILVLSYEKGLTHSYQESGNVCHLQTSGKTISKTGDRASTAEKGTWQRRGLPYLPPGKPDGAGGGKDLWSHCPRPAREGNL